MTAIVKSSPAARPLLKLDEISIDLLHESTHNPRTQFDQAEIAEMAESLTASGQFTPILVRPHPTKKGGYELATGACRRRAAILSKRASLTAIVRAMDDATFVGIVNMENRLRNNLHPLDEARGFADWMKTAGLKVPDISARIGLSEDYVYDRLRLLQLTKPAQKLFLEGRFTLGHAIPLSRLSAEDQAAAIGDEAHDYTNGGLFDEDHGLEYLDDVDQPELEVLDQKKPRSVREFQQWINDRVRFEPEQVDLKQLFPETAAQIAAAEKDEVKTIAITRDHVLKDSVRAEERTFGPMSWTRADGVAGSKTCDRSVLGIVKAGPGRGEAFRVCIDKKRCTVHYATEVKAAAKRERDKAKGGASANGVSAKAKQEADAARAKREQHAREVETARWVKAIPALREALASAIKKASTGRTGRCGELVLRSCAGWNPDKVHESFGAGADGVLREGAFRIEVSALKQHSVQNNGKTVLKAWGIDAQKIVDRVAPPIRPVASSARKPAPKKKVRR